MLLSSAPVGEINQVKAIWVEDKIKTVLEEMGSYRRLRGIRRVKAA